MVSTKKGGSIYYCTAPIVTSATQARAVYWLTDYGSCCAWSGTSCWNAYSSPGSISGAYLQVRRPEYMSSTYSDARVRACARLAMLNASITSASICALPAVYVVLNADPEAARNTMHSQGMTYVGIMTGLWPLVLGCIFLVCFAGTLNKKKCSN